MAKKKTKVEMRSDGNIVIDGVEYILNAEKGKRVDGHNHPDRWLFTEFDKETYDEDVAFIVKNIELMVTKEELLKEIVSQYPLSAIRDIRKSIEKGEPIIKSEGCITLNFGKKEMLTLVG